MNYDKDLLDDVTAFIESIEDEIKAALIDRTAFDNIDGGDIQCRMEESIYTPFSLEDAVFVIDNCENEETDAGLWEGLDPSDAIIAMAVYSYRADAWFKAEELYDEMLTNYEDYIDRFDDVDNSVAADVIWDWFISLFEIKPVETGGITELAILEHWIRLNKDAGTWSGYPLGGAYIDARCGTGYSMPNVKNFVDCDRTVRYQLPHMNGKYCADVEARIDELKEGMMTCSDKHHAKLDELIDGARKHMHGMMDSAMLSGAISHDMAQPHSYFLSRAIVTIYGDMRPHAPPGHSMLREIDELAKVL